MARKHKPEDIIGNARPRDGAAHRIRARRNAHRRTDRRGHSRSLGPTLGSWGRSTRGLRVGADWSWGVFAWQCQQSAEP